MNRLKEPFEIDVKIAGDQLTRLKIFHETETFDFAFEGQNISLINNGDNSWSLVTGHVSQEDINSIGVEIEKYYKGVKP
ncbi:hypothetical protein [Desertivirga xinjiangensis]|uniref:hypothetical protein n=1 Tax=Desertivirga xinjiangensis TaxID=539206 RepID=UPI00210B7BFE|nr:hypothetical protein [Pedobacter xinjiangensis]